jgi:Zn-dependent peptidase ImmA (M78 family)
LKFPTYLEDYIHLLYRGIHLTQPSHLNLDIIAIRLGLILEYVPLDSMHINGVIFIDSRKSTTQQWQDFGHELCHALMHFGNQSIMPMQYQFYLEWKAINFMYHACVPTFMLNELVLGNCEAKSVYEIQKKFHVEREFATKRLHHYLANRNLYYR